MSDDNGQWAAPGRPGRDGSSASGGEPPPPFGDAGVAPPPGPVHPQWAPAVPVFTPSMYADYRPGIVPLRPLLVSDILGGVTTAIRGNPAATLGLGLVTTLVFAVPAAFIGAWLATWANSRFADRLPTDMTQGSDVSSLFGALGSYVPNIASSFAVLLMTAFMAQVIGQGVIGRKTSLGETWAATKGRLLQVIGSSLLLGVLLLSVLLLCLGAPVGLIIAAVGNNSGDGSVAGGVVGLLVGLLLSLVLVIFLSIRFGFSASAIVLERLGVIAGMRRSWRLTAGQPFWRILGIRLLVGLMTGIGAAILSYPITLGLSILLESTVDSASTRTVGTVFIAALASVITGTLTTPFSAGSSTLLYIDQRIRREALDVQLVQAAQPGA